ncbi:MAG: type III-A CRISPR-associated RAMP protein Csm4 [Melioribacter sp.]|nr:type III-A CRISPR-associated RAMP protein Csm4 [Melioribacter sp.]
MHAIILKCKPGTLFRLGEGSLVDVSHIIHSDTLFSAITTIYEMVYGAGEEFVNLVNKNKMSFSSAFPLLEDVDSGEHIYFLPKPNIVFSHVESLSKKIKKIKYLSFKALTMILENFDQSCISSSYDFSSLIIVAGEYAILKNEIGIFQSNNHSLIQEHIFPKTAVHKNDRKDAFYFQTDIQLVPLKDNSGRILYKPHFFFLVNESLNEEEKKRFVSCLRILADEGIGGDRGSGKGCIEEIAITDFKYMPFKAAKYFITLSLVNPASQFEFDNCIQYNIIRRGGGSIGTDGQSDFHRKQVRMISEGSVIKSQITGRIVDISPTVNHYKNKIFRNGRAFLIPLGWGNE